MERHCELEFWFVSNFSIMGDVALWYGSYDVSAYDKYKLAF